MCVCLYCDYHTVMNIGSLYESVLTARLEDLSHICHIISPVVVAVCAQGPLDSLDPVILETQSPIQILLQPATTTTSLKPELGEHLFGLLSSASNSPILTLRSAKLMSIDNGRIGHLFSKD